MTYSKMIERILNYIKSQNAYGALFSKYNKFGQVIENLKDDPTHIISGFTGSNASVLINIDRQILFTDSRYYQRAEKETSIKVIYDNPYSWISKNLPNDKKILIDPTRHFYKPLESIRLWVKFDLNLYKNIGISDELCEEEILSLGKYSYDKSQIFTNFLTKNNADSALLLPENYSWINNIRNKNAKYNKALLRYQLFTLGNNYIYHLNNLESIFVDIQKDKIRKVCVDLSLTPHFIVDSFKKNNIDIVDSSIFPIQSIKSKEEIKGLKIANIYERENFYAITKWVRESVLSGKKITELDASQKLLEIKSQNPDFLGESFKTICAFGPNSSIIHYDPEVDPKFIENNDLLLIDSGSHYTCGTTDITRTISIGKPTEKQQKVYAAVLNGLCELSTQKFPSTTTGIQLEAIARAQIWSLGLDYPHGTGHGIGFIMNVHEHGCGISKYSPPLEKGMLTSCEPGCYIPHEFGVRLENNLIVEEEENADGSVEKFLKFSTLSCIPFDAQLINKQSLSENSKLFINTFGLC